MTKLESLRLSLAEQIEILTDTYNNSRKDVYKVRINEILTKNVRFDRLITIFDDSMLVNVPWLKFLHCSNCSVGRSFNILELFLSSDSRSIDSTNLEIYLRASVKKK